MIRALTVMQPWASAIVAGRKLVENRNWRTRYRGPLLIHAGVSRRWLCDRLPDGSRVDGGRLVYGAVLGLVELIDCVPLADAPAGPFAAGPWCWLLAGPLRLEPVPCAGRQLLWAPPAEVRQALARHIPSGW